MRTSELTRREVLAGAAGGAAALSLPGFLTACGSDSSDDGPAGVGGRATDADIPSFSWAVPETPATLDIATGFGGFGTPIMLLGLEGLLGVRQEDLTLKPLLAESWSQPNPLTLIYKIRSGVTFWDGTPVTLDDVVFSITRHLDPKSASRLTSYLTSVKSVDATGDNEVTITLTRPDALVQYVPVLTLVTPKAFSERLGDKLGTPGPSVTTMGTGPYQFTSFSTDDGLTLERNPNYWGDQPRVVKARIEWISNPETQRLALQSGDIDGVMNFPVGEGRRWDRIPDVNTEYMRGMGCTFLGFNMEAPPWNDIHVRRAVAHAADRAGYVRAFLGGHGRPATSVVAPAHWATLADESEVDAIYDKIPQYDYDLEKAKAEMAQSEHADGFSAEILVPGASAGGVKAMVSLSEALAGLGIDLNVREVPVNEWVAALVPHKDLGLSFFWREPTVADPVEYADFLFDSAKAVPNQFNVANWKNPTIDRLLRKQAATTDKAARARTIGDILRIAGEELPYLPLYWQDVSVALNDRFVYENFNAMIWRCPWLVPVRARA